MVEWKPYALYPIRITLALVFFAYGLDKALNYSANIEWFEGWGVPLAGLVVPVVMTIEFLGAMCLLLGVYTRVASITLSVVLLGAMLTAKRGYGIVTGVDLEIALIGGLVALAINGPGRPTLATIIQEWKAQTPSSGSS